MESQLQFFRFPLNDEERCELWIKAVDKENFVPSKFIVVCSKHFTSNNYLVRPNTYINRLNSNAIPSVLLPSAARMIPLSTVSIPEKLEKSNEEENSQKVNVQPVEVPCTTCERSTKDFGINENINAASTSKNYLPQNNERKLRCKLKVLQQKLRRQNVKIKTMSQLLANLQKKGLIVKETVDVLEHEFDGLPLALFKNEVRQIMMKNAISTSSNGNCNILNN